MKKGTIVHIDYDLYNADTESLLETTREEVAKEHDMHQEGRKYTPLCWAKEEPRKGFKIVNTCGLFQFVAWRAELLTTSMLQNP